MTPDTPIMSLFNQHFSLGFIGLGAMGKPMVTSLVQAVEPGAHVYVHDITTSVVEDLVGTHSGTIVGCASAKEVAEKADIVLTMLPEGAHVKSVYLDQQSGIAAALSGSSSKLLIDSSTIDTASSLHVKAELGKIAPEVLFYDAPVSGGVLGAEKGTVAFFVGCSSSDPKFPLLEELLRAMGSKVIPCGGPSLGLAAKLSNNYLSGIITIACSEAMDMGMRAGIDAEVLASVFAAGTAQNTICDVFNPVPGVCPNAPPSKGYQGGFRVQLMRKDIGLAVDMARRVGSRNVLGATGLGVYAAASEASDCKNLDSRVVYRYLGGKEDWRVRKE